MSGPWQPRGRTGQPHRALVFGASGYIGTNLVPFLAARGWQVRAAARNPRVLEGRHWPGVETVAADALQPSSLPRALAGIDVAWYLVHSMAAGRHFGRIDPIAAEHFAKAAAQAGAKRIVYLGGLIPDEPGSEHLRSRLETGERLRAGPVPVTEIRAAIIVGPGSAAFEVMRDLVFHLPLLLAPRCIRCVSPPIALANLLEYLERVATLDEAAGQIYDAAGPELLPYNELVRRFGEVAGRAPRIVLLPFRSPRWAALMLRLVTAVPTNIARALVHGMGHDIRPRNAEALQRLVPQRLLGFREAVQAAFDAERGNAVPARWVEGDLAFRRFRLDLAYYARKLTGSCLTTAPPDAVWKVLSGIGGENGWYYLNWLWQLRGLMDWLAGGSGLQRGRRDPQELRVGDRVDSYTVVALQPGRLLALQFGMKAPGSGILEFEIAPEPDGRTRLTAGAYWHPAGVWGILYWYAFLPPHALVFHGLTRAIARRAEAPGASTP